ncbi:MAG: hypothetical protein J7485_11640 [Sphingobium sp.]|nr:hypothetical protein [Sphingobium sp.]
MRRIFCVAALLVSACGPTGAAGDPDTDWAGAKTMPTGAGSVIFGTPRDGVHFSDPAYLPAWAPQYPGAMVMSKLVQRDAQGVIGRGTEFTTSDPYDKVVVFYADAVKRSGREPIAVTNTAQMAAYVFPAEKGYNSSIIIRTTSGESAAKVSIVIAVPTDR